MYVIKIAFVTFKEVRSNEMKSNQIEWLLVQINSHHNFVGFLFLGFQSVFKIPLHLIVSILFITTIINNTEIDQREL